MESYDKVREAVIFWGELRESFDSLDDWPVWRLYRYADGYIEAHTVKEKK